MKKILYEIIISQDHSKTISKNIERVNFSM